MLALGDIAGQLTGNYTRIAAQIGFTLVDRHRARHYTGGHRCRASRGQVQVCFPLADLAAQLTGDYASLATRIGTELVHGCGNSIGQMPIGLRLARAPGARQVPAGTSAGRT